MLGSALPFSQHDREPERTVGSVWRGTTYRDSKTSRHPIKVIRMLCHRGDLRHDRAARPFHPKNLGQFLQVLRARLADTKHRIAEPGHAERAQLVIEELHAQLRRQERDVLDDGQSHAPLFVLRELYDGWQEGLRQKLDSDDVVDLFELGDDVEAHVREVVLEHLEEHGEQVFGGFLLAENGREAGDLVAEGGADVLAGIRDEFFDRGHDVAEEDFVVDELAETCETQHSDNDWDA